MPIDRLFTVMVVAMMQSATTDAERERITEALEPPNRLNPLTGLPIGWDEETELDGFDQLLTG